MVVWRRNGDWPELSMGGSQLLHADALHTYVDVSALQAGPPVLFIFGVIGVAGRVTAEALVHGLLWLIGVAIALLAGLTARAERALSAGVPTSDEVSVRRSTVAVIAVLPIAAGIFLNRDLTPPLLNTCFVLVVLLWLWLQHRSSRSAAGSAATMTMSRTTWLALLVIGPWSVLASGWLHLDDGLAMLAMMVALLQTVRGRRIPAALAVGVAIACKPWAIAALPLLLRSGDRKAVCRDFAVALGIPAACWLPFVIAAPGTLNAARYAFLVNPQSTVYLFGLHDATAPPWLRTTQLAMILLFAYLGSRRSPVDALVAGTLARLVFDPAIINYYSVAAIAFVAIADVSYRRPAWRTGLAMVGLWLSPFFAGPILTLALLRTGTLGILLAATLGPTAHRGPALLLQREPGRDVDDARGRELVGRLPGAHGRVGRRPEAAIDR
jgi:hypothetical protein